MGNDNTTPDSNKTDLTNMKGKSLADLQAESNSLPSLPNELNISTEPPKPLTPEINENSIQSDLSGTLPPIGDVSAPVQPVAESVEVPVQEEVAPPPVAETVTPEVSPTSSGIPEESKVSSSEEYIKNFPPIGLQVEKSSVSPTPIQEKVKETVVYKDKGPSILQRLKRCSCLGCFGIIVVIIFFLFTIIARPAFSWNPLKQFLNGEFVPNQVEEYTAEQTNGYINTQVNDEGTSFVVVNEAQATSLFRDKFGKIGQIEFEPGTMRIVMDMDSGSSVPLWFVVEFREDSEGKLVITKTGFGRLGLPQVVNQLATSLITNVLRAASGNLLGDSPENLLSVLVKGASTQNIEVNKLRFDQDQVTLNFEKK